MMRVGKLIQPGDLKGLVQWLEDPENHYAAADAVAMAHGREDSLTDFIKASPEFQGWDRNQVMAAIDQANELELMEGFVSKLKLEGQIRQAIRAAIKESKNKGKKVVKIKKSKLAEAVRKGIAQHLQENLGLDMPGGVVEDKKKNK